MKRTGSSIVLLGSALLLLIVAIGAQNVPPRLQIPGAIPLGAFPGLPAEQQLFRSGAERVLPAPGLNRVRRPQQKHQSLPVAPLSGNYPSAAPAFAVNDAKPVNEDGDDEYRQPQFIPPNFQQLVQQQEQHLTESLARPPQQIPIPQPQQPEADRFPAGGSRFAFAAERQAAQQHAAAKQSAPVAVAQPQQPRRPAFRDASPVQYEAPARRAQQPLQSQHDSQRPRNAQEHQQQQQEREAKPVAQILRKYREENEDGSITWGFENDDGSFKEEFIGIDCITRGRYGYVDPDGMKREYAYETGIACDPNKKNSEEDDIADGYIDYQNQEMVLANGERVDIGGIGGKNKGRKSQPANIGYRN